ncbi:unnamed protein product [Rhizophagus irregularis]|nr:unnamed protein product [Rhizophagus irregularis]CAB4406094.1 unnamed protein product [Rhizophagus irregularis]
MSNANDNTQTVAPPPKRLKSSDEVSSQSDDWLSVVLNEVEVDPRIDTWNCFFQDSHVSRHKPQNSEITFNTPFIFKSVNPAQNLVNGAESNSQRRQEFSSNLSSFSTNFLSEDLVGKVVEVLGILLEEVKKDIWITIINKDHLIPASFLREFNKLVHDSHPNNVKTPFIKCVEEFRSFISRVQSSYLSPDIELFKNALNSYCQITSFITVVHMLFDTVVMDFLCENNEEISIRQLSVETFMNIFHDDDNFLKRNIPFDDQPPNASENLEAFTWYYRLVVRSQPQYQCDLSVRFHSLNIHFTTLEPIESILSILYTKHFLNVLAKEQQKDHGQFYTPREVMQFMWDRVLIGKGNRTWIEKLLGGSFQNSSLYPNQSSSNWGVLPQAPSVLDPCMGIGSFLCEYISRLILAAQQCPIVWNNSVAISNLLHSLSVNLWGIEIDAFAYHLCKINITLHILPLYKRYLHLTSLINDLKLSRLHLFCNDTLNLYLPKREHTWEYENLWLLRSPQRLKFDFIVTNPPYMIRKTGFISEPDSELFDERVLGKGGMQAYAYFFWFCVERCREEIGEVCLISASQWMGLEFADKLRAWMWQKCHLVEFFQFEPFKVWRKIQTDSLIFRLRRRSEPILSTSIPPIQPVLTESSILFLRYMNRKATLHETLQAYSNFDPNNAQYEKDMQYKLSLPYPMTQLPSSTNSYSFTFLMPSSAVSAYLHSITAHLPSLCDHASMKHTWVENNPLIWHRGPNTNPVYALVVRTTWAYSKFGPEVCRRWLRPVFYWNGKNGGKEAEFWQKMGDELRLEKKESSPAEAYVPFIVNNSGGTTIAKDGLEQDRSMYSLIMVDRDAVDKVRREFGENSEFWKYLKEARKYLQTGFTSREVVYCGTSKCGIDVQTKIIHPINYGYFSKNQPRQRFFIDEDNVCVTNQCIYFTVKTTTRLPPYFFLGILNSTTIQHFLSHHCKYDQQGRMRLFRENMAKIPYAAPAHSDGVEWFIRCVQRMILARQMLYEGIRICGDEDKVASTIVEKLRRGAWQLTGREWQEKESNAYNDETSVILREEQEGNWVMVKQCRGRGDGVEYSLCPGSGGEQVARHETEETTEQTTTFHNFSSAADAAVLKDHRAPSGNNISKTHIMKPFFESLLYASACLQYAIDQYVYTLYGINAKFQMALEEELKLELFEAILNKYPRLNGTAGNEDGEEKKGKVPEWGERLFEEVEVSIEEGQNLLRQKRTILLRGYKNMK